MEEINFNLNDLDPINISLNEEPKTNFGSGIELLMNEKNKSASEATDIDVSDLDKLEDDLNDLSKINLNKTTYQPHTPVMDNNNDSIKINFDESDSKIGKETAEGIGKTSTWDGFMKLNSDVPEKTPHPISNMSDREKNRKKRSMIKSLNDWQEKGIIKDASRFNNDSSYEEVEDEYEGALEDKRKRDAVKIQQNWLITFINTIEYGNSMFDPFGLCLDGWGENVAEDVDSYNEIFEELHEKYKGGKMSSDLQKQMSMINDLYTSSLSSGRLFAMKEVVRDLQAIVNKSVQSENDKYEGQSVIKAMHKVAELIVRYQKEIHEEEQANKQKV